MSSPGAVADVLPEFAPAFAFDRFNRMQRTVLPTLLESSDNAVISAPTGSGKTALAELAICRCLADGGTALFIAPLRALTAEKAAEWGRFEDLGYTVYVLTGDQELSGRRAERADILVMTPEKVDSATRKPHSARYRFITEVDCCVIDEVHLLGASRRGSVLEVTVSRLRRLADPRVVALSAAMSNPDTVATWLDAPAEHTHVFDSSYRPVPLETAVATYTPGENAFASKYRRLYRALDLVTPHLRDDGQAIVFVASRADARQAAETAADSIDPTVLEAGPQDSYPAHRTIADIQHDSLRETVRSGVGFHHAGLSASDREAVEELFAEGVIGVLCSTSTLAWGVNLPARCVVVRDTTYHDPLAGSVPIRDIDVRQMLGRAGRPGYDDAGHAWVIAPAADRDRFTRIMNADIEVQSQLAADLAEHLNAEIAMGTVSTLADAAAWLDTTFLAAQVRTSDTDIDVDARLHEALTNLADRGFIDLSDDEIAPTEQSRLAARYYLELETTESFCAFANQDTPSRSDLLWTIAEAAEFADVRARSDERDAIDAIVDATDGRTDGARKVLAVLRASMTDSMPGPLTADAWAIKRNADRLFGALAACCRTQGAPNTAHRVVRLHHRIEYGVDDTAVGFCALDGVGGTRAERLVHAGVESPTDIPNVDPALLREVGFSDTVIEQLSEQAADLPRIDIDWSPVPDTITPGSNELIPVTVSSRRGGAPTSIRAVVNEVEMYTDDPYIGETTVPLAIHGGDHDELTFEISVRFPTLPLDPHVERRTVTVGR